MSACQFCAKLLPTTLNEALGIAHHLTQFTHPSYFKYICFCKEQRTLPHECLRCGLPTGRGYDHGAELCVILLLDFIRERVDVMADFKERIGIIRQKAQEKARTP